MNNIEILKEFLIENPDYNEFVFHCPTVEETQLLVENLYKLGFYWTQGSKYEPLEVERRWLNKKKNTCISIGSINFPDKNVLFNGRMGMYVNQGRAIVEVSELFDETENTETNSVNGIKEISNENNSENKEKTCPECGTVLPKVAKFCTFCGYKFNLIQDVAKEKDVDTKVNIEEKGGNVKTPNNRLSVLDIINQESKNENKVENSVEAVEEQNDIKLEKENENTVQNKDNKESNIISELKKPPVVKATISNESENNKKTNPTDKKVKKSKSLDSSIDKKDEENSSDDNSLCVLLGVSENQPFKISNNIYNTNNNIFRINENGYREVLAGKDLWFICNNEQELVFLIKNKNQIIKMDNI